MDLNVIFITLVYSFVQRVYEWFVIKKLLYLNQIYNTSSLIVFLSCKALLQLLRITSVSRMFH